jgi:hypothetical protein
MPEIAHWNRENGLWETEQLDLLSGRSAPFSGIWPLHGSMHGGRAFARATWEPRTSAGGSSSSPLLPTPEASDGSGGRVSSELGGTRPSGAKRSVTLATQLAFLLPTPRAATARSSRRAMVENPQWSAPSLEQALELARGELPREFRSWDEVPGRSRLLPTPTASDGAGGAGHTTAEGSPNLRTVVAQLSIGEPTDPPSSAGSD